MSTNEIERIDQFLLKEYEARFSEYARLHQFIHNMGLTLLAVSGAIWAFCLTTDNEPESGLFFAILLPGIFGIMSLAWIVRYRTSQNETEAYLRFVIEPWFGAGRGFFEHLAVNEYGISPPKHHRIDFDPYKRFAPFFVGFPFQHIIIWASVVIFAIMLPKSNDWVITFSFILIPTITFEVILLLKYQQKRNAHKKELEKLWVQFRNAYKGPCPDSFRPIDWDKENILNTHNKSSE